MFRGQVDQEHPVELSIRVTIRDVRQGGGLNLNWDGYSKPLDFAEAAALMARFHDLMQTLKGAE